MGRVKYSFHILTIVSFQILHPISTLAEPLSSAESKSLEFAMNGTRSIQQMQNEVNTRFSGSDVVIVRKETGVFSYLPDTYINVSSLIRDAEYAFELSNAKTDLDSALQKQASNRVLQSNMLEAFAIIGDPKVVAARDNWDKANDSKYRVRISSALVSLTGDAINVSSWFGSTVSEIAFPSIKKTDVDMLSRAVKAGKSAATANLVVSLLGTISKGNLDHKDLLSMASDVGKYFDKNKKTVAGVTLYLKIPEIMDLRRRIEELKRLSLLVKSGASKQVIEQAFDVLRAQLISDVCAIIADISGTIPGLAGSLPKSLLDFADMERQGKFKVHFESLFQMSKVIDARVAAGENYFRVLDNNRVIQRYNQALIDGGSLFTPVGTPASPKTGTIKEIPVLATPESAFALDPRSAEPPEAVAPADITALDPPVTAPIWAGRMSLSGRLTDGDTATTGAVEPMRASGDAPVNGFILFSPNSGALSAPLAGRQAQGGHVFSHLIWGDWSGGSRNWARLGHDVTELSGFFVYGEATPSTAKTSGTASYTGRLRGDVSEQGSAIQRGVAYGEFGLSADFGTGALGGWLAVSADDTMTTYAFASDFENARILRQSDGLHFHGEIGANYADAYGYVEGYFYGPSASELGGSYELINPGNASTQGILFGWQTASMPVKPAVADGSKRAHISTQLLNGYILDSAIDIATVPVQGAASVAFAAPPEQGGGTVSTSQVYAKNGYSYTSWGKWRANDSTPESYSSGGYWAAGQATLPAVIQNKTGTAVYAGEIIGDHVAGGTRQPAQGSVNLTADFSADRITGEMEFHTATTAMTPAPIDAPIQDSGVFAQFGNDAANGNFGYGVQGNFFGPNAEEVGGSAWASTSEGSYNGVFRAKQ